MRSARRPGRTASRVPPILCTLTYRGPNDDTAPPPNTPEQMEALSMLASNNRTRANVYYAVGRSSNRDVVRSRSGRAHTDGNAIRADFQSRILFPDGAVHGARMALPDVLQPGVTAGWPARAETMAQCDDTIFKPRMPNVINAMQPMRAALTGSPSTMMPKMAVPTVPIPVHTA